MDLKREMCLRFEYLQISIIFATSNGDAGVVELVDTPDLGSGVARLGGSSPFARTRREAAFAEVAFLD